jgi:hypothetical protein
MIKCLSIRQPWAWAIFHGKDIENRTWATKYRGGLLIHAAKTFDIEGYKWLVNHRDLLTDVLLDSCSYTTGCIIGKVTMTDCIVHSPSSWFFGPYGFVFENPVEFKTPIPFKGALKFFDVPADLINGE